MDFCRNSSGVVDFENTVDRGSAMNFGADSGLCGLSVMLRSWSPKRSLDHRSFFSLGRYVNGSCKLFSLLWTKLILGVRLSLELYCAIGTTHVAFFTICTKLPMAFTFTNLPYPWTQARIQVNFNTSVSGCQWLWFQISTKSLADRRIWRKKAWNGGFAYPYSPPPPWKVIIFWWTNLKCRVATLFTFGQLTERERGASFNGNYRLLLLFF